VTIGFQVTVENVGDVAHVQRTFIENNICDFCMCFQFHPE